MNETLELSMQVLTDYSELSNLIQKDDYSEQDKKTIIDIVSSGRYPGLKS